MADLAASDVAVSVGSSDREMAGAGAFKNMSLASITFGGGALTYPTNGVPLPAIGTFGFRKAIDFGIVAQAPGDGFIYKFDQTNRSIRVYTQGFKTGSTEAGGETDTGALVKNSLGVEGTPRISKTVASTTYDMGQMIEVPAATVLPATTLQLFLIGE
jgi:hypothetical protein